MVLAFVAGVFRLPKYHMLMCLLGLFGICVLHTYLEGDGRLSPWPYVMGVITVSFAIAAHIAGLLVSTLITSNHSKRTPRP